MDRKISSHSLWCTQWFPKSYRVCQTHHQCNCVAHHAGHNNSPFQELAESLHFLVEPSGTNHLSWKVAQQSEILTYGKALSGFSLLTNSGLNVNGFHWMLKLIWQTPGTIQCWGTSKQWAVFIWEIRQLSGALSPWGADDVMALWNRHNTSRSISSPHPPTKEKWTPFGHVYLRIPIRMAKEIIWFSLTQIWLNCHIEEKKWFNIFSFWLHGVLQGWLHMNNPIGGSVGFKRISRGVCGWYEVRVMKRQREGAASVILENKAKKKHILFPWDQPENGNSSWLIRPEVTDTIPTSNALSKRWGKKRQLHEGKDNI